MIDPVLYPADCIKIRKIAEELGYDCTLKQAEALWEDYSAEFNASWLCVDETTSCDGIEIAVKKYFTEVI